MKLAGREKKILYAGIAVAVAIMIYYAATTFMPDNEQLEIEVASQKNLLIRQRALLGKEELYKKRVAEAEKGLQGLMKRLLPGDNVSVAGAELQRILKDFADQSSVEITQKNNLPERKVTDGDALIKVSVRIQTNCNLDELVDFLTAIKNYDKYLKVEELTINTFRVQKRYAINPSLTVVGYISAPPPQPAAKPDGGSNRTQASAAVAQSTINR